MTARPEDKAGEPPQAMSIARDFSVWIMELTASHAAPTSAETDGSPKANCISKARADGPGRPPCANHSRVAPQSRKLPFATFNCAE